MQQRNWFGGIMAVGVVLLLMVTGGCSNKGGREGKVEVVLSERLKAKGVVLEDWRYSPSEKSFGVKLKANTPLDQQTYIRIYGPGIGQAGSPMPVGNAINRGEWLDFGGSKVFGNPFDNFPESGTITIDIR